MPKFRTYFEKNNTLLKGTFANTSKNPVTQLYYGGRADNIENLDRNCINGRIRGTLDSINVYGDKVTNCGCSKTIGGINVRDCQCDNLPILEFNDYNDFCGSDEDLSLIVEGTTFEIPGSFFTQQKIGFESVKFNFGVVDSGYYNVYRFDGVSYETWLNSLGVTLSDFSNAPSIYDIYEAYLNGYFDVTVAEHSPPFGPSISRSGITYSATTEVMVEDFLNNGLGYVRQINNNCEYVIGLIYEFISDSGCRKVGILVKNAQEPTGGFASPFGCQLSMWTSSAPFFFKDSIGVATYAQVAENPRDNCFSIIGVDNTFVNKKIKSEQIKYLANGVWYDYNGEDLVCISGLTCLQLIQEYYDGCDPVIITYNVTEGIEEPVKECDLVNDCSYYSRYIFKFDEKCIEDLMCTYCVSSMTHTLHMTNTSSFNDNLFTAPKLCCPYGFRHATSFDLVLFKIPECWDEGVGYDYCESKYIGKTDKSFIQGPSNWFERVSGEYWLDYGGGVGWATEDNIVGVQHFDNGDENLEIDITHFVNSIIFSGETNHGLGLAFRRCLEIDGEEVVQYVGFFSKYTQTMFEPYVESTWDAVIKDDRCAFYQDETNRLYLYANYKGKPIGCDDCFSVGEVRIYDCEDELLSAFTGTQITQQTCGVYYIDLCVTNYPDTVLFRDEWDVEICGKNNQTITKTIEMEFMVMESLGGFNIGSDKVEYCDYYITMSGISDREKVKRGDIRKIIVSSREEFNLETSAPLDCLQWRMYAKEGPNQIPICDWEDINMTYTDNHFIIDTRWMLPNQTYYIDIKSINNGVTKIMCDTIQFDIVGEIEGPHIFKNGGGTLL